MKSAILLSSMAVMASGAKLTAITTEEGKANAKAAAKSAKAINSKAFPKVKGLKDFKKISKTGYAAAKKKGVMSTTSMEVTLKEEGIVGSAAAPMGPPGNFFEIRRGYADCDSTAAMVEGFEVGRCVDGLYSESSMTTGTGMSAMSHDTVTKAMSSKMVKPNNGGFPIEVYYNGTGCRDDRIYDVERAPKTDFGFPPDYKAGHCMPVHDEFNNVMFYQGAFWNEMRFEPSMSYGIKAEDGREPGCQKGKFAHYDILGSYMCREDEDEYGYVQYSMLDTSSCNMGVAMMHYYSGDDCDSSTYTHSDSYSTDDKCLFDLEQFQNDLMDYFEPQANFEYSSVMCRDMGF